MPLIITQHYPKTKKYISLFPPEVRSGKEVSDPSEAEKTNAEREEVRSWIREQMEKGDLEMEPELHLDSQGAARVGEKTQRSIPTPDWDSRTGASKKIRGHSPAHQGGKQAKNADDFFEDEDKDEDDDDDNEAEE